MSPEQWESIDLIVATSNPGKIAEIRSMLASTIAIRSLSDLGIIGPQETGTSFAENAALKAIDVSNRVHGFVLADDSGLEVDALGGAPGVYSARFAGEPPDDRRNIEMLLKRLSGTSDGQRTARFKCSIAVARNGAVVLTADGTCEGRIGYECRGSNGFGYDPIFVLPSGHTMAELGLEEKNQISHRAVAFRNVAGALLGLIDEPSHRGDTMKTSESLS